MKLKETLFEDGRPVGQIVQDSKTGAVDFVPREERRKPSGGPWRSVDELREALALLYGDVRGKP